MESALSLRGIIPHIVREHGELAAFQWAQLRVLEGAQPFDQAAFDHVKARLAANLDAIVIAGDEAWPILVERFKDYPEAGELFVISHLAIALQDGGRIDQCLHMADHQPGARGGLAGALQWLSVENSAPIVRRMVRAESPVVRAVALDVLAHHRAGAGDLLTSSLSDPSAVLRASACALAAATGRTDCATLIAGLAKDEDPDLRMAALSALAGLGTADAPVALKAEIAASGPRAVEALRLLAKALPMAEFLPYLGTLYQTGTSRALAVRGIGMTGDRNRLDWLIEQMANPETAVAAGESFLELFPEAAGVEGLFTDDAGSLGPSFEGQNGLLPVAAVVEAWAKANVRQPD